MIRKEFVKRLNLKGRRFLGMLLAICMMTGSMVGCGKKKEHKLPIKQDEVSVNEVVDEKADVILDTTIVSDLQEVDHYTKELNSSNGNVKINIDAPVKKVEMDNYPVVKVRREKLDDAILEKVASVLNPSDRFVDGNSEKDIDIKFRNVADLKDEYSGISDSDCETGKIDYEYYSNLMEYGELFYGVSRNESGNTAITAVNSDVYGSYLMYNKFSDFIPKGGLVIPAGNLVFTSEKEFGDIGGSTEVEIMKTEETVLDDGETELVGSNKGTDSRFGTIKKVESSRDTNNISEEEAKKLACDFLTSIELGDRYAVSDVAKGYVSPEIPMGFSIEESDYDAKGYPDFKGTEGLSIDKHDDGTYDIDVMTAGAWCVTFQKSINGIPTADYGEMYEYGADGTKKEVWFNECIEVLVNDNGIVGFLYSNPTEVSDAYNSVASPEGGSDDSTDSLLDFEKIMTIYEEAQFDVLDNSDVFDGIISSGTTDKYTIKINDISLKYTRYVNNEEEGMLLPVWDFSGTAYTDDGEEYYSGSFMQINALDGSIYDSHVGK